MKEEGGMGRGLLYAFCKCNSETSMLLSESATNMKTAYVSTESVGVH